MPLTGHGEEWRFRRSTAHTSPTRLLRRMCAHRDQPITTSNLTSEYRVALRARLKPLAPEPRSNHLPHRPFSSNHSVGLAKVVWSGYIAVGTCTEPSGGTTCQLVRMSLRRRLEETLNPEGDSVDFASTTKLHCLLDQGGRQGHTQPTVF